MAENAPSWVDARPGDTSAMADTPTLVDTRQAAELLGVHPRTIRRAAAEGALRPVRLRERSPLRFRRDEIEALILPADPSGGVDSTGTDPSSGSASAVAPLLTMGGGGGARTRP
jgi:excisionase family DNA binding protein